METRKFSLTVLSLLLIFTMAVNLTGCGISSNADDLMWGITPKKVESISTLDGQNSKYTDFALRLLRESNDKEEENVLLSPLSVILALSLAANGAEGKTLEEMEKTLGMTRDELNMFLYSYVSTLPESEDYYLRVANSIWFKDDENLIVRKGFLQTNADFYGASVYKAPFDKQTCNDINNWVKEKTEGVIPEILDEIPENTMMYLVNALAFEGKWMREYSESQVNSGEFTKEDGTIKIVDFMYGSENTYYEDEKATGFSKPYMDGKYAFVALLPREGISVSQYLEYLTAERLNSLLNNPKSIKVNTSLPKFESMYSTEMSEVLKNMGMPRAFDDKCAEFEKMATYKDEGLYMSRVLHKAYISVGEKGTKAGAATVIEMPTKLSNDHVETKTVYLDRPFLYMIVDTENNIPFFIGTMMDVK